MYMNQPEEQFSTFFCGGGGRFCREPAKLPGPPTCKLWTLPYGMDLHLDMCDTLVERLSGWLGDHVNGDLAELTL